MAGLIPPDFIDNLIARVDIIDVIGTRVPLRRAGKELQACCPFHDEKTPSFFVSPEKQFYHCFGCGAHGTAIGFLMEYDRLSFREAVGELAQQAGLALPDASGAAPSGLDPGPLYETLRQAAELFRRQLREHPERERAHAYLKQRGLTGEVARDFGLGFAPPGWDNLLSRLGTSPEAIDRLNAAGLIIDRDGKRYDRFRDRIMFPIRDRRGRIIAFGGRVLGDGEPKYLNSPETAVFHKGRELYGLYEAQQAQRRPPRLLVVEGYMDVIALAQFGLPYAVATLGTATTPEHVKRLLRSAPELVFCFDGDRAGRDAAWKALKAALPLAGGQQPIRFLFLPEGEDPDTLVRKEGHDAFERRLGQATLLSELLFEHVTAGLDLDTAEGRSALVAAARPLLDTAPAGAFRQLLEQRLATLTGLPARATPTRAQLRPASRLARGQARHMTNAQRAAALLLNDPALIDAVSGQAADWREVAAPDIDLLIRVVDAIGANANMSKAALYERFRGSEHEAALSGMTALGLIGPLADQEQAFDLHAEVAGAIRALNEAAIETRRRRILEKGVSAMSAEEIAWLRTVAGRRRGSPA